MLIKLANEREMATIDHVLYNVRQRILTARRMDGGPSRNVIFDLGDGKTANQVTNTDRLAVEEFIRALQATGKDRYEFTSKELDGGRTIEYVKRRVAPTLEVAPPPALLNGSHRTRENPTTTEEPATLKSFPIPEGLRKKKKK